MTPLIEVGATNPYNVAMMIRKAVVLYFVVFSFIEIAMFNFKSPPVKLIVYRRDCNYKF